VKCCGGEGGNMFDIFVFMGTEVFFECMLLVSKVARVF
jgi:hypothetical protein